MFFNTQQYTYLSKVKYILLILGIFLAFSPNGLCSDTKCCTDIEVTATEDSKDCAHHCNTDDATHDDASHEDSPQQAATHACDCCMITMVVPVPDVEDIDEATPSSPVITDAERLCTRYAFSIWNPPNRVV